MVEVVSSEDGGNKKHRSSDSDVFEIERVSPRAFWLTAVMCGMMGQDRIESRDLCYWRNYNMVIMFLQILEQPKAQQAHTLQLNYFFRSPQ